MFLGRGMGGREEKRGRRAAPAFEPEPRPRCLSRFRLVPGTAHTPPLPAGCTVRPVERMRCGYVRAEAPPFCSNLRFFGGNRTAARLGRQLPIPLAGHCSNLVFASVPNVKHLLLLQDSPLELTQPRPASHPPPPLGPPPHLSPHPPPPLGGHHGPPQHPHHPLHHSVHLGHPLRSKRKTLHHDDLIRRSPVNLHGEHREYLGKNGNRVPTTSVHLCPLTPPSALSVRAQCTRSCWAARR